jgi:hypothetical protein
MREPKPFSTMKLYKEHEQRFFSEVVAQGRTYRYHHGDYLYTDVKRVAKKYGIVTEYNSLGTSEYIRYGCFNFTVVSILESTKEQKEQPEPEYFDVNELAI